MTRRIKFSDEIVKRSRDIYEDNKSLVLVQSRLRFETGKRISINTIRDWVYFRTRWEDITNDPILIL